MSSPDNKTRKRKWDDQGEDTNEHEVATPPNPSDALAAAAAVAAKLQSTNVNLQNSSTSQATATTATPSSDPSKAIQQQVNEQLAKITANLQAKGINIQKNNTNAANTTTAQSSATASPIVNPTSSDSKDKINNNNGIFSKNVEINDVKNRYMLTKASFLDKLQEETKAEIITRGKYYTNKANATPKDPPLYLHVAAESQEILDNALKKIQEIIDSTPPVLVHTDTTTSAYHKPAGQPTKRFHQAKIFIGIDDPTFNAKMKLIGIQGANVKHINRETGARLQLRGKGSGFKEPTSGKEAYEPMFFQISSLTEEGLEKAKQLVDDLIKTVKGEYERFKQYRASRPNNPRPHYNPYSSPYGNMYQQPGMTTQYQAPGYTYPGYTYPPQLPQTGTETAYSTAPAAPPLPNTPAPPLQTSTTDSTQAQSATTSTVAATTPSYYQTAPTAATQNQYYNYMYNPYYYYQPPLPAGAPPLPTTTPPLPPSTTSTTTSTTTTQPSVPYQPQSPNTK